MRITVNLSIFFHDHRSLAKIFINKKMKCIKDVENHITDIFKIQNFYLKCDNQYLPPTEDVQILNYDDIVWAVPEKDYAASINGNGFLLDEEIELEDVPKIEKKKKKKKELDIEEKVICEKKQKKQKKHLDESLTNYEELNFLENNEDLMEVENTPIKPKKRKKNKKSDVKDASSDEIKNKNSEGGGNNSMCEIVSKKQKVEINSSPQDANVRENSPKDSGRDSLEGSKLEDATPEDKNTNVKSLVHTFENRRINFARHFRQAVSDADERRVNIVKTIIISNKSNTPEKTEPKPDSSNLEDVESPNQQKDQNFNVSDSVKNQDNVNTDHDEDSSNVETSNSVSYSTPNGVDANVNKRKRKRTRSHRRKPKSSSMREVNATFEQPVYNFIHQPLIVHTPTHIRFGEEQSTPKCNEDSTSNELVINNEQKVTSKNEVIVISESPAPVVELVAKSHQNMKESIKTADADIEATHVETAYSDKDIEECILKQPITANAEPRVGDVIAFKIIRMSENYTPEISSTVVGKVINYNPKDKEIVFNIVYGRDQCQMPQGKFYLDHEDLPTEDQSRFQCCWSSLLEPRLLFP